jgi:hypothetical protein
MATEGPRTKGEALVQVASEIADRLEDNSYGPMLTGVKMSPAQRERVSEAVDEVIRRLRAMGPRK